MASGNFLNVSEIKCELCKYSSYTDEFMELEYGKEPEVFQVQCRRHAPRPTLAGLNATVLWPLVMNTDSCGEYEAENGLVEYEDSE